MMRLGLLFLGAVLVAPHVTAELPSWYDLADRARWAANAHNMQSWRLEATGRPDQRRLILDAARLLPNTDPPHRQLTISLGAFLAVLEDEARVRGAVVSWDPLVDQPGALVTLSEAPDPAARPPLPDEQGRVDALTAATVKYATQAFELSDEQRRKQEAQSDEVVRVRWLGGADVEPVKTWAVGAFDLEMDLPRTRDESIAVTRYGEADRKARPWGITLAPNSPTGSLFWVDLATTLFPPSPRDYAQSSKQMFRKALGPVTQVLVITSMGDGNRERLVTGRRLQRLWQQVRAAGGELLPLSQGLQEFPEMAGYHHEAHQGWARPGETVQMVLALFRPEPGTYQSSPRLAASAITD